MEDARPSTSRSSHGAPGAERALAELHRDPELAESLYAILYGVEPGLAELAGALGELEARHGAAVYSELVFLLCHLRFDAEEARGHWQRVLAHRESMQARLGTSVDLRVALASYFLQVERRLDSPKIIELKLFEQTRASAYRDELTGLHNYRFFAEFLRCELARAGRSGAPLSLVMLDVDDFKLYNDRAGHEAGNAALRDIASILIGALRESDVAARYGGEEFVVVLPGTPKDRACLVAERVRGGIEQHAFDAGGGPPGGALTASLGLATFPGDAATPDDLVRCADRAMYEAKAEGKNRVRLFGCSHRSFVRVDVRLDATLQVLGGPPRPALCTNLGDGGLALLADHAPPPGVLFEASVTLPDPLGRVVLAGRVVQVAPAADGRFTVRSRIVSVEPDDQRRLAAFLGQRGAAPRGEALRSA